ncbi:hypothetical protein C8R45DRAFT_1212694 [Mycena sanguinolenta]|nr:hypothetical protein C8R45DRAFT_1212694 [Mycena sanguinolenta]
MINEHIKPPGVSTTGPRLALFPFLRGSERARALFPASKQDRLATSTPEVVDASCVFLVPLSFARLELCTPRPRSSASASSREFYTPHLNELVDTSPDHALHPLLATSTPASAPGSDLHARFSTRRAHRCLCHTRALHAPDLRRRSSSPPTSLELCMPKLFDFDFARALHPAPRRAAFRNVSVHLNLGPIGTAEVARGEDVAWGRCGEALGLGGVGEVGRRLRLRTLLRLGPRAARLHLRLRENHVPAVPFGTAQRIVRLLLMRRPLRRGARAHGPGRRDEDDMWRGMIRMRSAVWSGMVAYLCAGARWRRCWRERKDGEGGGSFASGTWSTEVPWWRAARSVVRYAAR